MTFTADLYVPEVHITLWPPIKCLSNLTQSQHSKLHDSSHSGSCYVMLITWDTLNPSLQYKVWCELSLKLSSNLMQIVVIGDGRRQSRLVLEQFVEAKVYHLLQPGYTTCPSPFRGLLLLLKTHGLIPQSLKGTLCHLSPFKCLLSVHFKGKW